MAGFYIRCEWSCLPLHDINISTGIVGSYPDPGQNCTRWNRAMSFVLPCLDIPSYDFRMWHILCNPLYLHLGLALFQSVPVCWIRVLCFGGQDSNHLIIYNYLFLLNLDDLHILFGFSDPNRHNWWKDKQSIIKNWRFMSKTLWYGETMTKPLFTAGAKPPFARHTPIPNGQPYGLAIHMNALNIFVLCIRTYWHFLLGSWILFLIFIRICSYRAEQKPGKKKRWKRKSLGGWIKNLWKISACWICD